MGSRIEPESDRIRTRFESDSNPIRIGIESLQRIAILRNPLQRFIDPGIYPGFIRDLSGIYPNESQAQAFCRQSAGRMKAKRKRSAGSLPAE